MHGSSRAFFWSPWFLRLPSEAVPAASRRWRSACPDPQHLMGGPLTGAPFNPARALGPMVATGDFIEVWLYMIAPLVGAVMATLVDVGLKWVAGEESTI